MIMPWTLVIVTLMSCSDPLVKEWQYFFTQEECERGKIDQRWVITPGQHFECRPTVVKE
jgi:hypothetical protein